MNQGHWTEAAGKIALATIALGLASLALATEPCPPNSWFAKQSRSPTEWKSLASWVAVGTVTARDEKMVPFANCYLKDRSQCAMDDRSAVTVKVASVDKGTMAKGSELKLQSAYCAPPPPKVIGATYRFYGSDSRSFIYFAKP